MVPVTDKVAHKEGVIAHGDGFYLEDWRGSAPARVTSPFPKGAFRLSDIGRDFTLNDDFCIGGNEEIVSPRFRACQTNRLLEEPSNNIILAHVDRRSGCRLPPKTVDGGPNNSDRAGNTSLLVHLGTPNCYESLR